MNSFNMYREWEHKVIFILIFYKTTTYSKLIDCYSSYWGCMSLKLTHKNTSWKIPDNGRCVTRSWHYHIVYRAHCKASHSICVAIQALLDTQLLSGIFPYSHHLRIGIWNSKAEMQPIFFFPLLLHFVQDLLHLCVLSIILPVILHGHET
jgi:hypothetical protein